MTWPMKKQWANYLLTFNGIIPIVGPRRLSNQEGADDNGSSPDDDGSAKHLYLSIKKKWKYQHENRGGRNNRAHNAGRRKTQGNIAK